jgi:LuxR family maltose regulon positive regulatory protein
MAEVFENQPPEVQEFLLRASTANPVCGELADALTGRTGGERTLAELYSAHVFLDRIQNMHDDRCTWYRWHPMFAGLLRQRLRASDRDLEGQLHRTASEWYRHHGFPVEAVRHAVAGGDVVTAAFVLGDSWLDLVLRGESAELRSLLALFDESEQHEHAELAVACGFIELQERELDRAAGCAERAVLLSPDLPADTRLAVDMMSEAIRLHVATMTGQDADNAYRSALLLLQQLEGDRARLTTAQKRRRVLLLYHVGACEVSRWLYQEPKAHLQDVMAAAGTLGMTHLVLRARAQLAFIDFFSGRLRSAQQTAQEIVDAAERHGGRSHHSLATAHHVLGGVDIFRGDLDAGLHRLIEAREAVHPVDEVNRFRIGFTSLVGLRAKGTVRAAREEFEHLHAQYQRWKAPPKWAEMMLLVTEAEQLALEGHIEPALELLDSVPEDEVHPVVRRHRQVFHAQLLLRSGKPAEARTALQPIIQSRERWLIDIRVHAVDALAAEALGRHEESLQALSRAVERAAVEEVREPFLVSGPQARPLLQELLSRVLRTKPR